MLRGQRDGGWGCGQGLFATLFKVVLNILEYTVNRKDF